MDIRLGHTHTEKEKRKREKLKKALLNVHTIIKISRMASRLGIRIFYKYFIFLSGGGRRVGD